MYSQTKACIKGHEVEFFKVGTGVQQGAPLSPILFALYLNDLDKDLQSNNTGFVKILDTRIYSLLLRFSIDWDHFYGVKFLWFDLSKNALDFN